MKRAPYPTDLPSDSLEIIEPDRLMKGEDVDFYPLSQKLMDAFILLAIVLIILAPLGWYHFFF